MGEAVLVHHAVMYRFVRPALFLLPPELAHHLGMWVLRVLGSATRVCSWLRRRALGGVALRQELFGLKFEHPIALAAGLDKDAVAVSGLFGLGFAAVEVGTLTPRPQAGNPTPRMFRAPTFSALVNRMGFNNAGAESARRRLAEQSWRPGPVGVNIGKNADTPLTEAVQDYVRCVDALAEVADYLVVNASSPNTPGLRKLQEPKELETLLLAVQQRLAERRSTVPLLLKIAPDLADEAVEAIVDVAMRARIAGLICTNTTLARPPGFPLAEAGGLSGTPLRERSTVVIRRAYRASAGRIPIIGVGGVFSAEDAYEKIRAGASLVQVYTGFIYQGPGMVKRMLQGLSRLLARDGFATVAAAVGADAAERSPRAEPMRSSPR